MHHSILILACFCLVVMLFWKKTKITSAVFFHTAFVGVIVSISGENHNFPEIYQLTKTQEEYEIAEFHRMWETTQIFMIPVLAIWNYQWWFVGKEKERVFSHNI